MCHLLAPRKSQFICTSGFCFFCPGKVPAATKPKEKPVITIIADGSTWFTEVTYPFFAVFKPAKETKNSIAVIVCPGGAYVRLAVIKDGNSTANWLTGLGYTALVCIVVCLI